MMKKIVREEWPGLVIGLAALALSSAAVAATINGTAGNEILNGTSSADTIDGKGGNDLLRGQGGNDRLIGGTGQDSLSGGTGGDTFVVDAGSCVGVSSCKMDKINDYRKSQGDRIDVPGDPGKLSFLNPTQTGSDRLLIWGVSGSSPSPTSSGISFKGIVRLVGVGAISISDLTVI